MITIARMDTPVKLSIIVPCYNEAGNLESLLNRFREIVGEQPGIEVILVDNGSTDQSEPLLARLLAHDNYKFARSVRVFPNRGYGYGIMSGIRESRGDYIAWTHADLQTDPRDVLDAFATLRSAPDPDGAVIKGLRIRRPLWDRLFTWGMGWTASVLLRCAVNDINAQPKLFPRSFLPQLSRAPNDFSLDLFFLYQARKTGMTILEQPVFFGERRHGAAKGGGSLQGKIRLTLRTWKYIMALRRELHRPGAAP